MEIEETMDEYYIKIFEDDEKFKHVEILNTNTFEIFKFQYMNVSYTCIVLIKNFESYNINSNLIYTIIQKYG